MSSKDLVLFYAMCIRSILTYAAPVFYFALPQYLQCELERVQKRALSIINPNRNYDEALEEAEIPSINTYIKETCRTFFHSIVNTKDHRLNGLLPNIKETNYNLRQPSHFAIPKWKTNRFKNTFIMSSSINF